MEVCPIGTHQVFNGISISRNMPKEIAKAIKATPAIRKAGKVYSLKFSYNTINNQAILDMTSPNTDGIISCLLAPPHSIKRDSFILGQNQNAILDSLEDIGATPRFFAEKIGTPRTFRQKLTAFIEAFKIAFTPLDPTVMQEAKLHKILDKYKTLNMPQ